MRGTQSQLSEARRTEGGGKKMRRILPGALLGIPGRSQGGPGHQGGPGEAEKKSVGSDSPWAGPGGLREAD